MHIHSLFIYMYVALLRYLLYSTRSKNLENVFLQSAWFTLASASQHDK